jgi:four helix bundle protein
MEIVKSKIRSFTDLNAWKEGHKLVLEIYQITNDFPKDELFSLTNQLKRAGVSVTSNLAEGFSRQSYKEKVQFYAIALGSVTEIQNQLLIARDVEYLNDDQFKKIANQSVVVHKLINGLIKGSKSFIHNS